MRVGTSSVTTTNTHHDGGGSSHGIVAFAILSCCHSNPLLDEPDAVWDCIYRESTWVDHAGVWPFIVIGPWPGFPDRRTEFNSLMDTSSIEDSISTAGAAGTVWDGMYLHVATGTGTYRTTNCRFARNLCAGINGEGGCDLTQQTSGSTMPTKIFEHSVWEGNEAGSGPALFVHFGQVDLRVRRSVFRNNIAYSAGGAIAVSGNDKLTMIVLESVFDSNAVRPPPDAGAADLTVRLNTGAFVIHPDTDLTDPAVDNIIPIWRVDNGPVHGISSDLCDTAKRHSATAVGKGFAESWPSDLPCANISYSGPNKIYNHVVTLEAGTHTLYTGVLMESSRPNNGWEQAWIEVVDTIDPLIPVVLELRPEQFPGCFLGSCAGVPSQHCNGCPRGIAMWSDQEFEVALGDGGAIRTSGPITMSISESTFRGNEAPKGASLSVSLADSLRVSNTTVDMPPGHHQLSGAVWLASAVIDDCNQNPCTLGSKCSFMNYSTHCEDCGPNEIGIDGITCSACEPGKEPDVQQIQCVLCPAGKASTIGICTECGQRETSADNRRTCIPCSPNQLADPPELGCRCERGYYDSRIVAPTCIKGDYEADIHHDEEECVSCAELECVSDCQGEWLQINPGWSPMQASMSDGPGLTVFACKYSTGKMSEGEYNGETSCPGGVVVNNGTACAEGYSDPLCGACQPGFILKSDGACEPCSAASTSTRMLVCAAVLILLAVLAKTTHLWLGRFSQPESVLQLVMELKAISKMLVATMQILGNLSAVLSIRLPEVFTAFIASFVSLFTFDIVNLLGLCISSGSYASTLATSVLVVVLLALVVGAIFLYEQQALRSTDYASDDEAAVAALREIYEQLCTDGDGIVLQDVQRMVGKMDAEITNAEALFAQADSDNSGCIDLAKFRAAVSSDADGRLDWETLVRAKAQTKVRDSATGRLMLLVFLLYPSLTNKILEGFLCREVADDMSILHADYSVACESTEYATVSFVCTVLTLLWPVGVPGGLFYAMYQVRSEILAGDKDTLQKFDFVLADYDTEHWYWEIVELIRKLILAGLIGLVGRGTVLQTVLATLISFMFFALSFREMPLRTRRLNVVKVLSELQLFVILLVCMVLRTEKNGFVGEWMQQYGYGLCQLFTTVAIVPATLLVVGQRVQDLRAEALGAAGAAQGEAVETANPLGVK